MSEYAKIEGGIVTQVIVADTDFISGLAGTWVLPDGKVGIGYKREGSLFSSPILAAFSAAAGDAFSLSVSAVSSDSVAYQWKKDGTNIGTNATHTIASLVSGDAGDYTCVVSDGTDEIIVGPCVVTVS